MRSASVGVWIGNGSRYETASENGISHFIEHMLFKSTEENASSAGACARWTRLGGLIQRLHDEKECTSFYFRAPDTDLERGIPHPRRYADHPALSGENELALERGVIGEKSLCMRDTPDELYLEEPLPAPSIGIRRLASPHHRHPRSSRVMTSDTCAPICRRTMSRRKPMVVGISGGFDDAVENLLCVKATSRGIRRRAPCPGFEARSTRTGRQSAKKPIESKTRLPGLPQRHPQRRSTSVCGADFFEHFRRRGMSSRLFKKRLREEKRPVLIFDLLTSPVLPRPTPASPGVWRGDQ